MARPGSEATDVEWLRLVVISAQSEFLFRMLHMPSATVHAVWMVKGAGSGPIGPQAGPKSTPHDPDRTSTNLNLQPHELYVLDVWGCFCILFVVLGFCVDPEFFRDGRGTSFPALGGRFLARGGGFGGDPGAPETYTNIYFYSRPDVHHV